MKSLADLDHYGVLDVPRTAGPEQIERAYRLSQATFAEDSLAGYSIFGPGEAAALRERIEAAYRVLSDAQARQAYDASLERVAAQREAEPLASEPPPRSPVDAFEDLDEESGEFGGARLRRLRLRRGLELEQISAVTKINPLYLRLLEEDRFDDLPAPVYVRGFVSAYAATVGLDAKRVAESYVRRLRALRDG